VFGGAALLAAGVTAFYMSRLFFMTFHGKQRWTDEQHPHESPLTMTVPMMVLAVGSALLGGLLGPTGAITGWLDPVVGAAEGVPVISSALLTIVTLVLVAVGVALAFLRYVREQVPEVAPRGSMLTRAARRDLYQDDVNEAILMRPGIHLTRSLVYADSKGIDGGATGIAALLGGLSARTRRVQNGFVRSYALTMLAGVVVILGAVWMVP